MEAVILAGGLGTRISSVLPDIPKCLAPIKGRAAIEIILDNLIQIGVKSCKIAVGYLGDQVRDHLGKQYKGLPISYSFDGEQLLGTGGAVKKALSTLSSNPVLVVNGDTLQSFELDPVLTDFNRHGLSIVVAKRVENSGQFGTIAEKDGFVSSFREKKDISPGLVNSGCYLLPVQVFSDWELPDAFSLENDFLPKLADDMKLRVVTADGEFNDFGTPTQLFRAQEID